MSSRTAKVVRQLNRLTSDFPTEADAMRRRAFWRVAGRYTPVLVVDRDGARYFVSTDDQVIGRRLFVYPRTPETDVARAFDALHGLPGGFDLTGRTVVEIGANIGFHTVQLLRHHGAARVVAIEPDPDNGRLLQSNVAENGLADRVDLLAMALSDTEGSVLLERSKINSGDHRVRIAEDAGTGEEADRVTIEVRSGTFDNLVEAGEIDLDDVGLIWMDAQGHEGQILAGADRLLEAGIPMVMEFWPYGLRRAGRLEEVLEMLQGRFGHVIDVGHPDGPRAVEVSRLANLEQERGFTEDADATDLVVAPGITADWRPAGA